MCHLWNLNEDQVLSGMIIHYIQPGMCAIHSFIGDYLCVLGF